MAHGKYAEWLSDDGLLLLSCWARDGLSDEQIAHNMGIHVATLYDYKKRFNQISEALKKGKEIIDYEVENSLLKKCLGYKAKEQKAFKCKEIYFDKDGNKCQREIVQVVDIEISIPPDTMAIAIWLNNRKATAWRRNAGKERLDEKKFEHDKQVDDKRYF